MTNENRHARSPSPRRPKALILAGGWEGHTPEVNAEFAEHEVLNGFEVHHSRDLAVLDAAALAEFDLLVPIWTFGDLSPAQERGLLSAVESGLGLLAWHGFASAFLGCRSHKFLLGGQFVSHPGGDAVTYTVRFEGDDPLVAGLSDVTITSEQYYLLVDPAVKVLATTSMSGQELPWTRAVRMPQVWTRSWGRGRVFYSAPGHTLEVLRTDPILTLLRRAARWAARAGSPQPVAHAEGEASITLNVGPAGVHRSTVQPAR